MLDPQLLAEINLLTFKELDKRKEFVRPATPNVPAREISALEEWHDSIYSTPFGDLPDDDIARICGQSWEKQIFVPLGLDRLRLHPFAGWYDGHLLKAIGEQTPRTFWREHPELLREFCSIINSVVLMLGEDAEDGSLKPEYDQSVLIDEETRKEILHLQAILSCR